MNVLPWGPEPRAGLLDRLCCCWEVGCWLHCETVLGCMCVKCVRTDFECFEFGLVRTEII